MPLARLRHVISCHIIIEGTIAKATQRSTNVRKSSDYVPGEQQLDVGGGVGVSVPESRSKQKNSLENSYHPKFQFPLDFVDGFFAIVTLIINDNNFNICLFYLAQFYIQIFEFPLPYFSSFQLSLKLCLLSLSLSLSNLDVVDVKLFK